MQARPSPRRPLDSWVDDGGSMPVPDDRMRGIRSIRERSFLLGRVWSWPDSTVAAIDQRASRHPPIDARGGSRCCRSCRSQTPRAGTVMTAQTEAVDFLAFDNSYARLPDRFFARLRPTPVAAPRLAACRTEVHSAIANDVFAGANGHRTLDRIQRALLRSLSSLRLAILGCI